MIIALKCLTPAGEISTLSVPRAAEGPSIKELLIGSEGIFGVITSATLRIHRLPKVQKYFFYVFENFEEATRICREWMQNGFCASAGIEMLRVSDEDETEAMWAATGQGGSAQDWLVKKYLSVRGIRSERFATMLVGQAGSTRLSRAIPQAHCVCLGSKPGKKWLENRFFLPYLRDDLLDQGILVDTFETAASWDALPKLYAAVRQDVFSFFGSNAVRVYTHLSHLYVDGASLYFTVIARQDHENLLGQWDGLKKVISQSIVSHGGVISHHHGIGQDHMAYLSWGQTERLLVTEMKKIMDPHGIMNPGKLL